MFYRSVKRLLCNTMTPITGAHKLTNDALPTYESSFTCNSNGTASIRSSWVQNILNGLTFHGFISNYFCLYCIQLCEKHFFILFLTREYAKRWTGYRSGTKFTRSIDRSIGCNDTDPEIRNGPWERSWSEGKVESWKHLGNDRILLSKKRSHAWIRI